MRHTWGEIDKLLLKIWQIGRKSIILHSNQRETFACPINSGFCGLGFTKETDTVCLFCFYAISTSIARKAMHPAKPSARLFLWGYA